MNNSGKFVISLDFELLWGVRDIANCEAYKPNILGVWECFPKMIEVFEEHKVKATFATVGFLFASTKEELLSFVPKIKPGYENANLSPYNGHFDLVEQDENKDKYHFATELISLLKNYPNQELATHTFSHYYCLEKGQSKEDFENDLKAAIAIAATKNVELKSIVFPRNQFNQNYIPILKEHGIIAYRGNESAWYYNFESRGKWIKRACRLLDSYVNLSGHNTYKLETIKRRTPHDIPSSRFLRPFSVRLKAFEKLRLQRILKSMTYAAKNNEVYHLWWHPHNFSAHQVENFSFLENILQHYVELKRKYGFESLTMNELSNLLNTQK